ncbi:MAG: TraR/DksA C4-type zinc finger protein [Burkholderiales bacterium]|nr:TraR/DksA C4-type zinc finger protein [Burkholderiales bacterium]
MGLTLEQQRKLRRLIEEEHRRFARTNPESADRTRIARQLRALEAARGRLADGTFGRCVACGRDIELDRLIAHPIAVRCLSCQHSHEQDHPKDGDADA